MSKYVAITAGAVAGLLLAPVVVRLGIRAYGWIDRNGSW